MVSAKINNKVMLKIDSVKGTMHKTRVSYITLHHYIDLTYTIILFANF